MTESQEIFIEILRKNLGSITQSCEKAGIKSRQTYYNWLAEDDDFRIAVDDVQEHLLDFVESQQMLLIRGIPKYKDVAETDPISGERTTHKEFNGWEEKPNQNLIRFYLERKGRKRGYIDQRSIILSTPEAQRLQELSDQEITDEITKLLAEDSNGES